MENEMFNQNELNFFGNIYNYLKDSSRCDNLGNISSQEAHDFFLSSSNLSKETILQIGDVTGGNVQGWYNEKQLFLALKLMAAAQQGIPITSHIPLLEMKLPLPNLFTNNNTQYESPKTSKSKKSNFAPSPNLINLSDSDSTLPKASADGYQMMVSEEFDDVEDADGTSSRDRSPPATSPPPSPGASSAASDSPTPTNSTTMPTTHGDRHWGSAAGGIENAPDPKTQWHIIVNEEHHQLLAPEEESSDRHSDSDDGEDCGAEADDEDASSVVGKKRKAKEEREAEDSMEESPEEDDEEDVWTMTAEQQQYYAKQFSAMQPNVAGFLPGTAAKHFFEKSKLPVTELRQIWQLCDVSRDGALSLEEFQAAMHLVVLRRNQIKIPDTLPKALLPKAFTWTKFCDSPTSTVSSPGPKPANFDFHKSDVEKDPKILHPTPLRLTPETKRADSGGTEAVGSFQSTRIDNHGLNLAPPGAVCPSKVAPSKANSKANIVSITSINPMDENGSGPASLPPFSPLTSPLPPPPPPPKEGIPPPPPPRPAKSHVRSSSLDLNQFNAVMNLKSPPPSYTISPGGALVGEVTAVSEEALSEEASSPADGGLREGPSKHSNHNSAFEVYRKPVEESVAVESSIVDCSYSSEGDDEDSQQASLSLRAASDKRDMLSSLQTLKERNAVLLKVNSELNQELVEVIEDRMALEYQLEQMKSFAT